MPINQTHRSGGLSLEYLVEGLGGTWHGRGYGTCPCPVCQADGRKDQNALTVNYGDKGGVVMNCKKMGCDYREVISQLRRLRLWPVRKLSEDELATLRAERDQNNQRNLDRAQEIWDTSMSIHGTPAEAYLRSRGIDCEIPGTLRYVSNCYHAPSEQEWPAMIARITGPTQGSIHRTYLTPDGRKAPVDPDRMLLGSTPGGGVVLCQNSPRVLAVAEGIETALCLQSGHLAAQFQPMSVVASLSAAGMAALRLPVPPPGTHLVIASDGDPAGHQAAQKLAIEGARIGFTVHHAPAPPGIDWNDVLRGAGQ